MENCGGGFETAATWTIKGELAQIFIELFIGIFTVLFIHFASRAGFYIGCVIEGLDYLHSRGIVYRYLVVFVVVVVVRK